MSSLLPSMPCSARSLRTGSPATERRNPASANKATTSAPAAPPLNRPYPTFSSPRQLPAVRSENRPVPPASVRASIKVTEAPKVSYVALGHVPPPLREHMDEIVKPRGAIVELPSGALHEHAFRFEDVEDTPRVRAWVEAELAGRRVDSDFVPHDRIMELIGALIADVDKTVILDDSTKELRALVPGAEEKEQALRRARNKQGLTIFDEGNKRDRTRLLAGLTGKEIGRYVAYLLQKRITSGAEAMFDAFRHADPELASGGLSVVVKPVAKYFGLTRQTSIEVEIVPRNGKRQLSGEMGAMVLPGHKVERVEERHAGLPRSSRLAVIGDGLNDIDMFRAARAHGGFAVAYHAVPDDASPDHAGHKVEQAATAKIRWAGLDAVPHFFIPLPDCGALFDRPRD
jgi:phosphoserine phosphatase